MHLSDFFASSNDEIISFLIYHTMFFFVFYGSFRPIWAQNELTRLSSSFRNEESDTFEKEDKDKRKNKSSRSRTLKSVQLEVIHYGWQTRKRNEWTNGHKARWVVMNPEYFYSGFIWTVLYTSAAYGAYYVLTYAEECDLRTVSFVVTTLQAFVMGIWSIPGFYWDLPGWSIILLFLSSVISIANCIIYGVLEEYYGLFFYAVYTLGQISLTLIYGISFIVSLKYKQWTPTEKRDSITPSFYKEIENARERGLHHKKPLGIIRSLWTYGLYPVSYMDRDISWLLVGKYRQSPPLNEKKIKI